jgi:ADP-ribose pyrophosphatase YjhB (NUDIX family)
VSQYYERFRHCPCCGTAYRDGDFAADQTVFRCASCGHAFYQNAIPSVTAVVPSASRPSQVVMITRMTPPAEGALALPGGFTGYRELPEAAVVREVGEETQLAVEAERRLLVHLIDYLYEGGHVSVLEHAFLCRPVAASVAGVKTQEASRIDFYELDELIGTPDRLAFPEHVEVLARYRDRLRAGCPGEAR